MIKYINSSNARQNSGVLDCMFRERKRIFVDRLHWDVPVIGQYEVDQFDNDFAEYVIICDHKTGDHLASMRILRTDRPHLLDTVFPMLCAEGAPSGPEYRELTRLCISLRLRATERLRIRNRLFTSLIEYALLTGIEGYTGVSEMGVYQQMLALGWRCTPLGLPQVVNGQTVGAILAHIEPDTIHRFKTSGTCDSGVMQISEAA